MCAFVSASRTDARRRAEWGAPARRSFSTAKRRRSSGEQTAEAPIMDRRAQRSSSPTPMARHLTTAELALDKDLKFTGSRQHDGHFWGLSSTFASCVPTICTPLLVPVPQPKSSAREAVSQHGAVDAYRAPAGRSHLHGGRIVETRRADRRRPGRAAGNNLSAAFRTRRRLALTYDTGDYDATQSRHRARRGRRFEARQGATEKKGLKRWQSATAATSKPAASRLRASPAPLARARLVSKPRGARASDRQGDVFTAATATARATRRPSRRWSPIKLGNPARRHSIETATRRKCCSAWHLRQPLARRRRTDREGARQVIAKARRLRPSDEAADSDVVFEGGVVQVTGTDKAVPFAQVSLTATCRTTFPQTKLSRAERERVSTTRALHLSGRQLHLRGRVDPTTGVVRVDRFTACDDFGNVINPMIVEARCTAARQGIGQALLGTASTIRIGPALTGST